jgi:hypothetical protein
MKKPISLVLGLIIILFLYYHIDYKRDFVSNNEKTKFFTIWKRLGNRCYIIPGKYLSPFRPSKNFIATVSYRNYIGVIWDTKDKYEYKISIYNSFSENSLSKGIKTYRKNDSLLLEYKILDSLNYQTGVRIKNRNSIDKMKQFDYNYIKIHGFTGIDVLIDY